MYVGLTGVATVKNLVEIGFDAVGFERSEWIGGLWRWSADETHTTVTKSSLMFDRTRLLDFANCFL